MKNIFGKQDLFIKDPLTGKFTGPVYQADSDSVFTTRSHHVYLPEPFGSGFSGPYSKDIETEPSPGTGLIVLLLLWFIVTGWLIYHVIRSYFYAIKSALYGFFGRALKFLLIAIVSTALLIADVYLLGEGFGFNRNIRSYFMEKDFSRQIREHFHYEMELPNCSLADPSCFNGTVRIKIVNDTEYSVRSFYGDFLDDICESYPSSRSDSVGPQEVVGVDCELKQYVTDKLMINPQYTAVVHCYLSDAMVHFLPNQYPITLISITK